MKVTNAELANTVDALNKLIGKEWPVDISLAIVKLASTLQGPLTEMDIVRQGLVKKYGISFESDEAGNTTIKSETEGNVLKYVTGATDLANIPVEVKVSEKKKINLPRKVGGKPLQIEPSILLALEKFIEVK